VSVPVLRGRAGRIHPGALVMVVVLTLVVGMIRPSIVLAAHAWTIGTSTSSVVQHVSTAVSITIQNTSTNDGGGDSTGCVQITVPTAYSVDAVTIDSVGGGYSWTAGVGGTGPTTVTLAAINDHNRLRGDPQFTVLQATITVTGHTVGSAAWSALEYEHWDCKGVQGPAVSLPMAVTPGVNAAPTAVDDSLSVVAGQTLTVAAPGILANDVDPEDDPLTAILLVGPARGSLVLSADGGVQYTPDPGFAGTDSFTYYVSDGTDDSGAATVTITVTNQAPTAIDDAYVGGKNQTLTVPAGSGVLANDSDPDVGHTLTAVLASAPASGTVTLAADGSFTYAPQPSFTGPITFTYRAFDGVALSDPATVTLVISNQAPVANADTYGALMNLPLIVTAPGVLANDGDPNGDAITAQLVSGPSSGTLLLFSSDGGFTYQPNLLFVGSDSFTYRVGDGQSWSTPATVTIVVGNTAPVAANDAASTLHGRTVGGNVLANDTDPDGHSLTAALVDDAGNGSLVLDPGGAWTYLPDPGFVGTDGFTYRASDGLASSNLATVTITVTNTPPTPMDDAATTLHGRSTGGDVLANDTDADGDALSASLMDDVGHGSLSLASDGTWTYQPSAGFVGTDTFTYTVSDGAAISAPATVTIIVTNTIPTANDDTATVHHRGELTVIAPGVLGNDVDADGDSLAATLVDDVDHGTLAFVSDGSYVYAPDAGFVGVDTFTYTVSDGAAISAPATVTITVTNAAPISGDDAWSVRHDRQLVVAAPGVLANDADPDSDPLTAAVLAGPGHGVVILLPDGSFSYTPAAGFVGTDSFTYAASDGAATSLGTVTISVTNAVPVTSSDTYTVMSGSTLVVPSADGVLANDDDPDGDALSAVVVGATTRGTLTLDPSGRLRYVPDAGFVGTDWFTYRATDGIAASLITSVRITVLSPPPGSRPPIDDDDPSPPPSDPDPDGDPAEPSIDPSPTPSEAPPTEEPIPSPEPSPPEAGGPVDPGSQPTGETWSIGAAPGTGDGPAGMPIVNLAASTLGLFGKAFDWLVPGAMLTVPGLLLILAIGAQAFGALAWLPLVRRKIGGFGFGADERRGRPAGW
jgi:VCBS repeat-containing protein